MSKNSGRARVRWFALLAIGTSGLAWSAFAQTAGNSNEGADFSPKPPIVAKSPEEQAKTFVLPPGYRMELVLADPQIENPAIIEFDGNGRMYVAEFVTYMRDIDGTSQYAPENRITRWEDTNGDGTYDRRTLFADKLVLPRMILPLDGNSILTNETRSDDVIKLTDTNGDGVADRREIFYQGVGLDRDGNLEHEQSGFVWGLDNWIYSTYNAFRFRWTPRGMQRESTGANNGQWGLAQDDDGKMWFVNAGSEQGPRNFQVPIHYGSFTVPGEYEPDFLTAWPIVGLADTQGGMGRVRQPLGVVNHLTAAAGQQIVRGHRVPADLKGDLLIAEPVGRLIRRATIVKDQGLTQVRNAYPGSEFILSTDPMFRPVNIRTAPDGTIYIADMYRGIIQEGTWVGPGSYLRMKVQQYQLDKAHTHGRIWRLRFDGVPEFPGTAQGPAARALPLVPAKPAIPLDLSKPAMFAESPAQLVAHLTHENGFWRDTAQRLLVLRQDKSVVPALEALVRTSGSLVGRFHALWTLEGLEALSPALVREVMKDPSPRMRIQAIRASETLFKGGNKTFDADYRQAVSDADADVAIQAMMTVNVLRLADSEALIQGVMAGSKGRGVQVLGKMVLDQRANLAARGRGAAGMSVEMVDQLQRGQTIYNEVCFACHGDDGRGTAKGGGAPGATMAPPLGGSPRVQGHRDYAIKTLLHGMTGPIDGKEYTEVMIPMGQQKDDWIAAVASFVRSAFGNTASYVTPADVARVRATSGNRRAQWSVAEVEASLPQLLPPDASWKVTASQNPVDAVNVTTLRGWAGGANQPSGMWLQIELPEPVMLAEVQFLTAGGGRGAGAGARGGRGGAPPAGAPAATPPAAGGQGLAQTPPAAQGRGGAPPQGPQPAPAAAPDPTARTLQVLVSMNGTTWGRPVVQAASTPGQTNLAFTPVRAKFLRVVETRAAANTSTWAISNLRLYQSPTPARR